MRRLQIVAVALWLAGAGCSGGAADQAMSGPQKSGVETTGLALFEERVVGVNPGCVTCHSLEAGITLVGPSLYGIESRVAGLDTAAYIRQSILDPDAHVVDGFLAGQMSPSWGDYLSVEQIESLVELLTNLAQARP